MRIRVMGSLSFAAAGLVLLIIGVSPVSGQGAITFRYFYDDAGQLTKVVDSTGILIEYVYDPVGNILEVRRTTSTPGTLSILNFTPGQGSPLTLVMIQGEGFGSTTGANLVTFNGVVATVLSAAGDNLVVSVPVGALTGPFSVTVGGNTVTSPRDFVVSSVPVITSIVPNAIDATSPPETLQITGVNLLGATFSFLPFLQPPPVTVGTPQVNTQGTAALLPITVSASAHGRFTLVGTNTIGSGDTISSNTNTITVVSALDERDSDGDGFPDGLELIFGSDPFDASSVPSLTASGEVVSEAFAIRNDALPTAGQTVQNEAISATFTVLNSAPVTTGQISQEVDSATFSILNSAFNVTANLEAVSAAFSVLNSPASSVTISWEDVAEQPEIADSTKGRAAALVVDGLPAGGVLFAGETVILSVEGPDSSTFTGAELIVNGESFAEDATRPFEFTFTVPENADQLTFHVLAARESGDAQKSEELRYAVERDSLTAVVGEVSGAGIGAEAEVRLGVLANGLVAEFFDFESPVTSMPDLEARRVTLRRAVSSINSRNPNQVFGPDPFAVQMGPDYAARFRGWLRVDRAGRFRFFLGADDGARLVIDDRNVLELPLGTGAFQEATGVVYLRAGLHPIEATYFQTVGNGELQLSYEPPDRERQVIRPSHFLADLGLTATTDEGGAFRIENVPTIVEGLAVTVRAQDARGNERTGISNAVRALRGGVTDVGTVRIRGRR